MIAFFTVFMAKYAAVGKNPKIPEKCCLYSLRETFRVGISDIDIDNI